MRILGFMLAGLAVFTGNAAAQLAETGISHNYLEIGYYSQDSDFLDDEFDGLALEGQLAISDALYLAGSYFDGSSDILVTSTSFGSGGASAIREFRDLDSEYWAVSVGYHYPVRANTDLIAELGYNRRETELETVAGFSNRDSGVVARIGIRSAVHDKIELGANINYSEENLDDLWLGLNALFRLGNSNWAINARADIAGDFDALGAAIRYNFR